MCRAVAAAVAAAAGAAAVLHIVCVVKLHSRVPGCVSHRQRADVDVSVLASSSQPRRRQRADRALSAL